jgi:hypothetical protein
MAFPRRSGTDKIPEMLPSVAALCRSRSGIPEQNPKYSILDSQPSARLFSLEYAQLLTEGKNLKAEVVAGTEECAEAGEEADEKCNHESGFIA